MLYLEHNPEWRYLAMRRFSWIALLLVLVMLIPATAGAAAYDHVLKQGMRDSTDPYPGAASDKDIEYMQQRLKYYEYYTGNIDGIYGPKMAAAVKAFQKRNNLKVDGRIGGNTWAALDSSTAVHKSDYNMTVPITTGDYTDPGSMTVVDAVDIDKLKVGDKGEEVAEIQKYLITKWYFMSSSHALDGIFDSETSAAVKAFQSAVGLTSDGVVGVKTMAALRSPVSTYFSTAKMVRRTLRQGMMGYDVYIVKQKLNSETDINGNPFLPVLNNNYVFDANTKEALIKFQKDRSISPSGTLDGNSRAALWNLDYEQTVVDASEDGIITVNRPTLKYGSHGKHVRTAQNYLKAAGCYFGKIDGIFGAKMFAAVKAFQSKFPELKVDGIIGETTWNKLSSTTVPLPASDVTTANTTTVLKRGSSGSAVTYLQNLLVTVNLLDSSNDVDGKFGAKTETAVRRYQSAKGLKVDGKVGTETLSSLEKDAGVY